MRIVVTVSGIGVREISGFRHTLGISVGSPRKTPKPRRIASDDRTSCATVLPRTWDQRLEAEKTMNRRRTLTERDVRIKDLLHPRSQVRHDATRTRTQTARPDGSSS
jgi:hypothetical protein